MSNHKSTKFNAKPKEVMRSACTGFSIFSMQCFIIKNSNRIDDESCSHNDISETKLIAYIIVNNYAAASICISIVSPCM